ncbi:MAG: BACON domain-containing protein [Chloroflexi bacterium]|nr:BACON domain-containing protein [Chloroflexota bacterium]
MTSCRGAALALLVATLATLALATLPGAVPRAEACVFLRDPHAYEADAARSMYFAAMDAAAVDALFPGDPFFGLPPVEAGNRNARTPGARRVPQSLLRSIGWVESNLAMAARSVPFAATGPALVSFDCGYGIMQVTTGMTVPLGVNNQPTANQVSVATHYAYNIARGAGILAEKWNGAPELRPLAGTDTNSDPAIIENWYYATWSYNGFTGPGTNRSNHPLDPSFARPRERYRCDGSQSRTRYPYQELVWGCLASPPSSRGVQLWAPRPVSLPDLSQPAFFGPLALANFVFPYAAMDLPTPQPQHVDPTPAVAPDLRARALGAPAPAASRQSVDVRFDTPSGGRATIEVSNSGSGVLSWHAVASANWIVVDPPAGVALGADVACSGCARTGALLITVNPTLLQRAASRGSVTITAANGSATPVTISVGVEGSFEFGAPGTSRAY